MMARPLLLSLLLASAQALRSSSWLDASSPVEARVEALLAEMTESEKLWQLQRPNWGPALPATGAGLLEFADILKGAANGTAAVAMRNAFQAAMLGSGPGARLGIPLAFRLFSIHGAEGFGTTFPEGPGLGSSWDVDLVAEVGAAIAAEGRALGADMAFFVIHMIADARFGRQEEGLAEEPTLTAVLAAALVAGSHGSLGVPADAYFNDTTKQIAAMFKHIGAYGAPVGGLNGGRAEAHEHTVREVYLKPWRRVAAVGARGLMPSHNTVLGTPAHGSAWLLRGRMRGEYGMNASFFLSDTGDVAALAAFRLCSSDAQCAAIALNAGVDVEQPPGTTYLSLPAAIAAGLTTQGTVDDAVRRVLRHKFSLRLFDSPYVNESLAAAVLNCPAHRALAQRAAEEGSVLLINGGTLLPLPRDSSLRIAVVGPNGGCGPSGDGNGTFPPCEAQASMLGNYVESGHGVDPTGIDTIVQAMRGSGWARSMSFDRGCNIEDGDLTLLPAAVAAAAAADVIVAVLGDSSSSCGEGIDRDSLDLPGGQLPLLDALAALGKPLIVVLVHGRTVTFGGESGNVVLAKVNALLAAWRPGQMGGAAVSNLLWGAANPSGRLPNSWVRTVGQTGSGASPFLQERTSIWNGPSSGAEGRRYGTYWHAANPATPLFPFGFGLSYTSFVLSNLTAVVDASNASFPVIAAVTVSNSGALPGACVVQAYVQDPVGVGLVVRPWKRLVAFARVAVPAGGTVRLPLPLAEDDVAFVGDDMSLALQAGDYILSAGQSSVDDGGLTAGFTLPGVSLLSLQARRP
jgi:beta-glucosidase